MKLRRLDVIHIYFDEPDREKAFRELERFKKLGYWVETDDEDGTPYTEHCIELRRTRDISELKINKT